MKVVTTLIILIVASQAVSQNVVESIQDEVRIDELRSHLYFIASDELRGRNTGTIENENVCKRLGMDFLEEREMEGKPTLFFKRDSITYTPWKFKFRAV